MLKENISKRVKFFQNIALMVVQLKNEGIEFMPFYFYRTIEEQIELVKEGKSQILNSKHLSWLAIDMVLVKEGKLEWNDSPEYQRAGDVWESLDGIWGGRWTSLKDIYHFELKNE